MPHVLFVLTSMAFLIGARSEGDSDPASTMLDYVAAYNSGDIDEIMVFFSEDSAITGHPYPVEARGLDGIRELHVADRQKAAVEDPYMISNLVVAGDTLTWNQTWVSRTGQEYRHEGQIRSGQRRNSPVMGLVERFQLCLNTSTKRHTTDRFLPPAPLSRRGFRWRRGTR